VATGFAAVAEHAPTNDYALFCLGRALQLLGRHAEARRPLAQAAGLRPERRDYRVYRDRARAAASG
jgi:Flp pilus assembly protein TadD